MYNPYIPDIIKITARELRKNMTISEKIFWDKVRNRKLYYKFERQKPFYLYTENSWLDRYIIPDFICIKLKIIIEIDWNIHNKKNVLNLDKEKEKLLFQKGFRVIRFKNYDINNEIDKVVSNLIALFP